MYNLIEVERENCYGGMEYPKFKRPFPPNFFTRQYVGVAVDEEKKVCIFIDKNTDVVGDEFPFAPRFSLSVCDITDRTENRKKVCEETSGEPLWCKTLDEVMEHINGKY